ncbi:MAG: DUF1566 domain-containing protein [Desulfobacterales bacterium]
MNAPSENRSGNIEIARDPVIRTDQHRCFDDHGRPVSCGGSGQEAEMRPGAPWPEPRFSTRTDGVLDRLTGLFWMSDAGEEALPMNWTEAGQYLEALNAQKPGGRADWRLPGRRELFSLVSHDRINPALPAGHPFTGVFPGYYWSETTCAAAASQAWYVHMGGARVHKGMKHGFYMVWPVAGTPYRPYRWHAPVNRFWPGTDTVLDRASGRMWARVPGLGEGPVSWSEGLAMVAEMNRQRWGGYNDWRMPGVRELESLIEESAHSPALPDGHFFEDTPQGCWTSTTSLYEPSYAWVVYFQEGAVGVGFKPKADFGLWPVRTDKG